MSFLSKVRFRSIKIKGFRGRNFTLDMPENIKHHVFLMDSGTGKTTTINLLRWCFKYKQSEAKGKFEHMLEPYAHLLDMNRSGYQECEIIIIFTYGNEKYKYIRKVSGVYDQSKSREPAVAEDIKSINDVLEIIGTSNVWSGDKVFEVLVKKFNFSKSTNFCFFDGEKAIELIRIAATDVNKLIKMVENRITHGELKIYIDKIQNLKSRAIQEAKKERTGKVTNKAQKILENAYKLNLKEQQLKKDKIERLKEDIESANSVLDGILEEINKREEQIRGIKNKNTQKRVELKVDINSLEKEINYKRTLLISQFRQIISPKSYKYINSLKENIKKIGGFPEDFGDALINDCIATNKCQICGRTLDNISINRIKKMKDDLTPKDVSRFLHDKFHGNDSEFDLDVYRNPLIKMVEKIRTFEEELSLTPENPEEIRIRSVIRKQKEMKTVINKDLMEYLKILGQSEKELQKLKDKEIIQTGKLKFLKKRKPLIEKINETETILIKTQDKMKKKTIEVISHVISRAIGNILGKEFSAELSQEHGLLMGYNGLYSSHYGGMGGRLILSYIFAETMSLVEPIIIDTPVGNVGSYRKKLAKHIANNHSQVILLCLPHELTDFSKFFNLNHVEITNIEEVG